MKERPTLFSAPMVKALRAGTKTQTRRIVGLSEMQRSETRGYDWTWRGQAPIRSVAQQRKHPRGCWQDVSNDRLLALCPYGAPGDALWVKEAHAFGRTWDKTRSSEMPVIMGDRVTTWFRADSGEESWANRGRWRPSIFMPRWASRLSLLVTSIRVERLQDITEADARAEGVESIGATCDYRGAYCALWESINGAESWAVNPWVWVVGFAALDAKGGAT